jgi:hypothetical protein
VLDVLWSFASIVQTIWTADVGYFCHQNGSVSLTIVGKGSLNVLLYSCAQEHVRNDVSPSCIVLMFITNSTQAFLLRSDGGGF